MSDTPDKKAEFENFLAIAKEWNDAKAPKTETMTYPGSDSVGNQATIGYWNPIMGGQCPNCGYCPHCGRSGHYHPPYWPHQPQITWCKA